jgi:hypothetical protein
MKKNLPVLLLFAVAAGMTGCESGPYYGDVGVYGKDYAARVVFSDSDRALIRDYYRNYYRGLPPGLAKQGKIPPGHAKKMYRNQPLPPGLEWGRLPADLEGRLSRLPSDYMRVIVGTDVGIMDVRTRVIVDLIENLDD